MAESLGLYLLEAAKLLVSLNERGSLRCLTHEGDIYYAAVEERVSI